MHSVLERLPLMDVQDSDRDKVCTAMDSDDDGVATIKCQRQALFTVFKRPCGHGGFSCLPHRYRPLRYKAGDGWGYVFTVCSECGADVGQIEYLPL